MLNGLHRRPMFDYFSYQLLEKSKFYNNISTISYISLKTLSSFGVLCDGDVCKQLSSFFVSRLSCLSLWTRQNFQHR